MDTRKLKLLFLFIRFSLYTACIRLRFIFDTKSYLKARSCKLRTIFENEGAFFIKLGQLISVRPDIFSPELVEEMSQLQDSVPACPFEEIEPIFLHELGYKPSDIFTTFNETPFASGSVAQVYKATLQKPYRTVLGDYLDVGTELAIKVVKPFAEEQVLRDLAIVQNFVQKFPSKRLKNTFDVEDFLNEFRSSIKRECDVRREGQVAEKFNFQFRDDPIVTAPQIIWPYTSQSILTMQYLDGWTLKESAQIERSGLNLEKLAEYGANIFMRQVLKLGVFHGDLHASNILILKDGRIGYIDFGIFGKISNYEQMCITQILFATVYRDAKRALVYSEKIGLSIPNDKKARVIGKLQAVMEQELTGKRHNVKGFVQHFIKILQSESIQIPRGFGLLIKGLITVEGCARLINPEIDIIETAKPYVTRLVFENYFSIDTIYANRNEAWEIISHALAKSIYEI